MEKIKKQDRLEAAIQDAVIKKLLLLGWLVKPTHGNIYQFGFPDILAAHMMFGSRWIECKRPKKYSFTKAQLEYFPQFSAAGVGIWIVTCDSQVPEILMKPPNWYNFLSVMK